MSAIERATALLAVSAFDPAILWTGAYLAGALLVGALAVEIFRRYLRTGPKEGPSASDQLAHFRSLYEEGTISEEEFNSLRALLGGEMRRSARKSAPAVDVPPAAPQTSGDVSPNGDHPPPPSDNGIKPV